MLPHSVVNLKRRLDMQAVKSRRLQTIDPGDHAGLDHGLIRNKTLTEVYRDFSKHNTVIAAMEPTVFFMSLVYEPTTNRYGIYKTVP